MKPPRGRAEAPAWGAARHLLMSGPSRADRATSVEEFDACPPEGDWLRRAGDDRLWRLCTSAIARPLYRGTSRRRCRELPYGLRTCVRSA